MGAAEESEMPGASGTPGTIRLYEITGLKREACVAYRSGRPPRRLFALLIPGGTVLLP